MMIRAIIADDEPVARRRLRRLLSARPEVELVAECAGGVEAIERIASLRPDLVFLDVQMPDRDGFEVVEAIGGELPAIVFVTAFDQYAVRAFDVHAVDYLLKPYESDRFYEALDRALARLRARDEGDDERGGIRAMLREVLSRARGESVVQERIAVRDDGRTRFLRVTEVDWLESEGNYVRFHVGGKSHLVRGTISGFERRLDPKRFVRIHRGFLVNMDRVVEVQPWFGGDWVVKLTDGKTLRLSRTYRDAFHTRLTGLPPDQEEP